MDSTNLVLTSGFSYPSRRDQATAKTGYEWMKGYRNDSDVSPYWRIHNKLYDMRPFIDKHPGGKFWLEITQGSDITELFESYHFTEKPEIVLRQYFVRNVQTPRNSPFTFKENGFYKTLKRKVVARMKGVVNEPSTQLCFIHDGLFFSSLLLMLLAAYWRSYYTITGAGMILALATVASHNFFHQKDNWRMYVFDFGMNSSREWRITHGISHHMFPNTIYDYEISVFDPFVQFLPTHKPIFTRFSKLTTCILVFCFGLFVEYLKRILMFLGGMNPMDWTWIIHVGQYLSIYLGATTATQALALWLTFQTAANCTFFMVGLIGAHHVHESYVEGDKALHDKDWGLHQIAVTSERGRIMESLFLTTIAFGNHTMHHLFPAIDSSKLPLLTDLFVQTCEEFRVDFELFDTWHCFKGFCYTLDNTKVNTQTQRRFKRFNQSE